MVAMSKEQHIENFCKALVEIDDFKYSYEELMEFKEVIDKQSGKTKEVTPYNIFLKEKGLCPKTMGSAWKDIQENEEEMERLTQLANELNENEGRDNSRTDKKTRGPSTWNLFMKAHKSEKLTRQQLKDKWSDLSQEEKDSYKNS